jgi:hypothetical protein
MEGTTASERNKNPSVSIPPGLLGDIDDLTSGPQSRSGEIQKGMTAWVRVHRVLEDTDIERTDAETVELIEDAVREWVTDV